MLVLAFGLVSPETSGSKFENENGDTAIYGLVSPETSGSKYLYKMIKDHQ